MFMIWFDPDKKTDIIRKVQDACNCYAAKFGTAAALCLTSHGDALALDGRDLPVEIRGVSYVRPNNFYVGQVEQ